MLKDIIIKAFHTIFGYENYLKLFSIIKIKTLRFDNRKKEYLFFCSLLSKDTNIVVIGANIGITTIPFGLREKNIKIFAYEPQKINYKILNTVIKHFDLSQITSYNIGIGNNNQKIKMLLPIINGVKKHGMSHIDDPTINKYKKYIEEEIIVERLDERPELQKIKIGAMKVVAENYELNIFEGAKEFLLKNKPYIYCELWDNDKKWKVIDLIKSYGYEALFLNGKELKVFDSINYTGKNFFFKPINE